MTRICLVGSPEVNLRYELLSRETSREALATYDLERPFENALAVRTVSVGGAVSLLNDLQWYITRFVEEVLVYDPSVSDGEWLSRELAEDLRVGEIEPGETGEFLKVYGLETPEVETDGDTGTDGGATVQLRERTRLVEPLYVRRTDGEVPGYDLRDVSETLVVRLTESEFSP